MECSVCKAEMVTCGADGRLVYCPVCTPWEKDLASEDNNQKTDRNFLGFRR